MKQKIQVGVLFSGVALGVALSLPSVLNENSMQENQKAGIAKVNGQSILYDDYNRLLITLSVEKRSEIDSKQKEFLLQRLIDQELLIQRAIELGVAERDTMVRNAIVLAMLNFIEKKTQQEPPPDEVLKKFYHDNPDFFAASVQYRVQDETGKVPVPDKLLPKFKLLQYIGPAGLKVIDELAVGAASDVVMVNQHPVRLRVLEKKLYRLQPFNEIKPTVHREYLRRQSEQSLRDYLQWLRDRASIKFDRGAL